MLLILVFSSSAAIVLGPPDRPASGVLLTELTRQQEGSIKALYVPPSILEQWTAEPEGLEQAKSLEFVLFGGGALSSKTGNALASVTDVCQMFGSAETGQIQLRVPQPGERAFMECNPYEQVDMQPSDGGSFEMVLHSDPKFRTHRSLNHNLPHKRSWRGGDLFVAHPTKPGLWRFHARVDDLIVLSNGHKINPGTLESELAGHTLLSGTLTVGTDQVRPALPLELKSSLSSPERKNAMEKIWPLIDEVNIMTPDHGRILKSKIALSNPDKPFVRTPKGTIVRHSTIDAYAATIKSLYLKSPDDNRGPVLGGVLLDEIRHFVQEHVTAVVLKVDLDEQSDIFSLGLDSTTVVELVSNLKHDLRNQENISSSKITLKLIYENPTISQLALAIQRSFGSSSRPVSNLGASGQLQEMVSKWTMGLPHITSSNADSSHKRYTVIVTGSTGSLGSSLLVRLLSNPRVTQIYCLVRSATKISNFRDMLAGSKCLKATLAKD